MKFGIDIVYSSRAALNFVKIGEMSAILHGVDEFLPSRSVLKLILISCDRAS
jgi:hypothetical protein